MKSNAKYTIIISITSSLNVLSLFIFNFGWSHFFTVIHTDLLD